MGNGREGSKCLPRQEVGHVKDIALVGLVGCVVGNQEGDALVANRNTSIR